MKTVYTSLICTLVLIIVGCDAGESSEAKVNDDQVKESPEPVKPADTESPAAQAQRAVIHMHTLASEAKWEAYIDGYYGEASKITTPEEKQQLIDRFENRWGEKLIPVLKQASEILPIVEGGKATFKADGQTIYELHLGEDGAWGFHL